MAISNLQKARAAYQPKLPKALQGPVKAVEGAATQSVGNQAEIKELFPNTYGMPVITFEPGAPIELPAIQCWYHPFWWSGSWWSQRDFWPFRWCKISQSCQQALWFHSRPWRSC